MGRKNIKVPPARDIQIVEHSALVCAKIAPEAPSEEEAAQDSNEDRESLTASPAETGAHYQDSES
ncbi:Hypothetical predicted protein [Pelobates cultripes]|uniref:Uncharacterized protein n=1 Tax=Pelobates cultripes TaxID=61616 RepID=A0AAD1RNH6_PELCU|nr:Hypothetical predicted protein [Pelobates cultripes]